MSHLNIPLSRTQSTTRRSRRVVWILVIIVLFCVFIVRNVSTLWFTRDTIYSFAPSDTVFAVRIFLNPFFDKEIDSLLGDTTLISNRPITFRDLKPYIRGEMVIFYEGNNKKSVAIRLNSKIPKEILDAYMINESTERSGIVLLSEIDESAAKLVLSPKFIAPISFINNHWIGEIVFINEKKRGYIFSQKDGISVSISGKNQKNVKLPTYSFPENAVGYGYFGYITFDRTILSPMFLPLFNNESLKLINKLVQNCAVAVGNNNGKTTFFIYGLPNSPVNQDQITHFLKTLSALNNPTVQKNDLSDGSSFKELVSDPESVSVEQLMLYNSLVYKTTIHKDDIFMGELDKGVVFITNSDEYIKLAKQKIRRNTICHGDTLGISLKYFSEPLKNNTDALIPNNYFDLFSKFSSIGVKNTLFSTDFHFCK